VLAPAKRHNFSTGGSGRIPGAVFPPIFGGVLARSLGAEKPRLICFRRLVSGGKIRGSGGALTIGVTSFVNGVSRPERSAFRRKSMSEARGKEGTGTGTGLNAHGDFSLETRIHAAGGGNRRAGRFGAGGIYDSLDGFHDSFGRWGPGLYNMGAEEKKKVGASIQKRVFKGGGGKPKKYCAASSGRTGRNDTAKKTNLLLGFIGFGGEKGPMQSRPCP